MAAQRGFDDRVQGYRRDLLDRILNEFLKSQHQPTDRFPHAWREWPPQDQGADADELINDNGIGTQLLRLEVLLWGGDEAYFVVPAWLGFELVQLFYECSADWAIGTEDGSVPLTHAGGLVFCHVKTPIDRIRVAAATLADRIKEHAGDSLENSFDYLVLESIDYPTEPNMGDFFTTRYGRALGNEVLRPPLRPIAAWPERRSQFDRLLNEGELPKRQLYHLVDTLANLSHQGESALEAFIGDAPWETIVSSAHGAKWETGSLAAMEARLLRMTQEAVGDVSLAEVAERLLTVLGAFCLDPNVSRQRAGAWLHLLSLWDYIVPRPDDRAGKASPGVVA